MATETKQILEEIKLIRTDLDYIKGHIADLDLVLTDDDIQSIKEAEEDLKKERTKRLI